MRHLLKEYGQRRVFIVILSCIVVIFSLITVLFLRQNFLAKKQLLLLGTQKDKLTSDKAKLTANLSLSQKSYIDLKNQDQYVINQKLKSEIENIHTSYNDSITAYEKILNLQVQKQDTTDMITLYATIVQNLSGQNYSSADAHLKELNGQIQSVNDKLAAAAAAAAAAGTPAGAASAPVSNTPPGSGFSIQQVKTDVGTFPVAIVAADLGSTRVIVDTASDADCSNNCPVLSLGDYVARNGAFAGVNGSYFCPASYPSCAGKTNSFDTLAMNKNKVYFNSGNNVYSSVPVAVFGSGFARFIGASSGWGRDTGVDGVLANQPLLLSGGNIAFTGGSDPKQGSVGARSFVGNKGNTVYIGVVYNATVAEVAYALKSLGLENALNLDSGGSTALWDGGYKAGPGRNIPNAILFVRK